MKFTLASILFTVCVAAIFFAWLSQAYWFGPTGLHGVLPQHRLTVGGEKVMPHDFAVSFYSKKTNLLYSCDHCGTKTEIQKIGCQLFSRRDLSRFNQFTGPTKNDFNDHTDFYCEKCKHPVRLIGGTYEVSMMNPRCWFELVIEPKN